MAEQQLTTMAQPEDVAALKRLLHSPAKESRDSSGSGPPPPLPVSSNAVSSLGDAKSSLGDAKSSPGDR